MGFVFVCVSMDVYVRVCVWVGVCMYVCVCVRQGDDDDDALINLSRNRLVFVRLQAT